MYTLYLVNISKVQALVLEEENCKIEELELLYFAMHTNKLISSVRKEGLIDRLSYCIKEFKIRNDFDLIVI